jgi:hypothetical protein
MLTRSYFFAENMPDEGDGRDWPLVIKVSMYLARGSIKEAGGPAPGGAVE